MIEALIVIDVQNDFCPGGSLAVSHGDACRGIDNAGSMDAAIADLRKAGVKFV